MENKDKIYEQFKNAAGKAEQKSFDRMDAVWNRVEEKLDEKKKRRSIAWWKYSGVAALLLLFISIGNLIVRNDAAPVITPNTIPENNVTVIDTQKIKETLNPEKEIILEEEVVITANPVQEKTTQKSNIVITDKTISKVDSTLAFTGIITDESGLPIPDVNVAVKGKYTQTDFDGKFTLNTNVGDTVNVSYVGMKSQSLVANYANNHANVAMADSQYLSEVVIEGYRSTKPRSIVAATTVSNETYKGDPNIVLRGRSTASKTKSYNNPDINREANIDKAESITHNKAVTSISSETIENTPSVSFVQSLQGQIPGLNITTGNGEPGSSTSVTLRGNSSLKGNNDGYILDTLANGRLIYRELPGSANSEPLYIIDGIPSSFNVFRNINPNDIQSVSILKDAEAASIHSNRGANGVIVVKTKKGLTKRQLKKIEKRSKKNNPLTHEAYQQYKPINPNIKIPIDTEDYESFEENKFENPATTPLSTFSIDVDNASYTNIRRFINNGQTVPKDAVRVEEMINFFKYQYPQPQNNEPFSINTEYSDAPWNPKHKLLKIGLQGKNIPTDELPASNFVFLIDVSGSMDTQNKLPLLKESMKILVKQMRAKDRIAIVVYAGAAGTVLPSTSGSEKDKIIAALDNLSAGGSTAGGEGIELAYKTAQENFIKGGNNRVILATDGDFNVGASSNTDMQTLIEEKRKSGVFLTCLGYGMGNYKDSKMEILADRGNGNYAYIDNMQEADRFLQKEFKGSMFAIAKDVKIQIEFNPKHVQRYRLIGYENRKLRDEDFTNDAIDAGELGSGHTVTALYEIIPTGVESEYSTKKPELKYSEPTNTVIGNYNDELATIKFRYKKPDEEVSKEIVKVIPNAWLTLQQVSGDFKFASAVAWFGLKLRDSKFIPNKTTEDILKLAKEANTNDPDGYRAEFIRLVERIE